MFSEVKKQIQQHFEELSKQPTLFYVESDRDAIWEAYLNGFPQEERQANNCNCCKSFIRQFGGIVAIIDNKVVSLWDIEGDEEHGAAIKSLAKYVKDHRITDVFLTDQKKAGTDQNLDQIRNVVWTHYNLPSIASKFHEKTLTLDTRRSDLRTQKSTFKRALDELKIDATETVLELIAQGSLYKGAEYKANLEKLLGYQKEYVKIPKELKDNYCWVKSMEAGPIVSGIRGSLIGTILIALSEGKDLDFAVTSYEVKAAPSNYKRPKALITEKMVDEARKTIQALGYEDSLERRYATESDLDINNILFTDRSKELSSIFDTLKKEVSVNPKSLSKIEEVSINDFITNIVPKSKSIEILLENKHLGNMVSLITADAGPSLFTWDNRFSWNYGGGVTDSMRERVVELGGRVDGVFRFTHSWNHTGKNQSLMDLHVFMPGNTIGANKDKLKNDNYGSGRRVGWNNRKDLNSGGVQDVDYVDAPGDRVPLENITFPDIRKMPEGVYVCKIHNWNARHPNQTGFKAEIEFDGQIFSYDYPNALENKEWITVAEVTLKNQQFTIKHFLEEGASLVTKEKWNLKTNQFHRVNKMMLSPNYWGQEIGNKHYLFMLEDCKSDETPRGFFNEFLKEDLVKHHKRVFEVLGGKIHIPASSNQLSGIGFSATQRASFIARVEGAFKRNIKVNI